MAAARAIILSKPGVIAFSGGRSADEFGNYREMDENTMSDLGRRIATRSEGKNLLVVADEERGLRDALGWNEKYFEAMVFSLFHHQHEGQTIQIIGRRMIEKTPIRILIERHWKHGRDRDLPNTMPLDAAGSARHFAMTQAVSTDALMLFTREQTQARDEVAKILGSFKRTKTYNQLVRSTLTNVEAI